MNYETLKANLSHLKRLRSILNYEVSLGGLYFISFYLASRFLSAKAIFIIIFVIAAAAILLTPYLLFVLYILNKKGWIIFFNIMAILPLIIIVVFLSDLLFYNAFLQIPLLLFYFYCFFLRFPVNEWTKEMGWKLQRLEKKEDVEETLEFHNFRKLKG